MRINSRLRFEVFRRDGFRCVYCGQAARRMVDGESMQVDHVVPVSRGGSDEPSNLVTACTTCNQGKSDTPLSARCVAEAYMADDLEWTANEIAKRLRLRAAQLRASGAILDVVAQHFNSAFECNDMCPASDGMVALQGLVQIHGASAVVAAISVAAQDKAESILSTAGDRLEHLAHALAGPSPARHLRVVR